MARSGLLYFIVGMVAVGAGLAASQEPWRVLNAQEARTSEQVIEMRRSEQKRAELVREEARYRSSLGREELARARGLLPANEKHADPE